MKASTVHRRAQDVFDREAVKAYVKKCKDEASSIAVLTRQEALKILSEIARGKLSDFFTPEGGIDKQAVAKAGYSLEEFCIAAGKYGDNTKIKVRSPIQAIERLSKMLDWDQSKSLDLDGVTFNLNLARE